MKTHNLVQGSPEWLAYRAQHFNASDAPAMMGCSAYKTRTQLLHEMHTGLTPDVDASTQRLFDDGHRSEALARPLAEGIIGEELYPVTGSEGKLSASFDGLTMDECTNFEHKRLNNNLRAIMIDGCTGADLDMMYQIQMEQQHMVSGAGRTLFVASEWDGEKLVEERHCWYQSNQELRAAILQGWTQFAIDLENYTPAATEAKPVGRTPETLPALHIEVTGMVTASNLAEYKAHALAVFSGINRDLVTDSDFANAESTVKWCGDIETRLAAAKQHALSQTASIDNLFKTIDDISAEARATRLELDKLVKNRKDSIRSDIVTGARNAMADHIAALNKRIGKPLMPNVLVDFANAIKGKRTLDSMRDAVTTELARVKIASNEMADKITLNLRALNEAPELAFLFADVAVLALKDPEFVAMAIKNRIADHQAKEAARLESERTRIANEERIKAAAPVPVIEMEIGKIDDQFIVKQTGGRRFNVVGDSVTEVMRERPTTPPGLSLGQISERLGFNVTSVFLASIGFEATTVKAAKLFHEADFPRICQALVRHINHVSQGVTA